MKIRKFAILGAALLLTSCSVGAEVITKAKFKTILDNQVKPTLVANAKEAKKSLSATVSNRDVQAKTYVENAYSLDTSKIDENTLTASHSVVNYVTKEIVNSAGLKTFSDVVKISNTTTYKVSKSNAQYVFTKEIDISHVKTDYLSIGLDVLNGRIAEAEIIIDDNIYTFSDTRVTYNTFVEKDDEAASEDDTPKVFTSLKSTEWTISNTENASTKIIVQFLDNIDTTVSKQNPVGKIFLNNKDAKEENFLNLYIFEKEDGAFTFEIRDINEDTNSSNLDTSDEAGVNALIEEFFAHADIMECEDIIINAYKSAFDLMDTTLENGKNEILSRQSGMVYRLIDGNTLKEIDITKIFTVKNAAGEDIEVRKISNVIERQGFNGNDIVATSFSGF